MADRMIDGIRRRLTRSIDGDFWDANQELNPEFETTNELPTDTAVLIAATDTTGKFAPSDANAPDYYKSLVTTAIENGGKHGGHQIPVPWLRMILAGLELKHVEPEMMWYGVEAGGEGGGSPADTSSYNDLFPPEQDLPAGPN